MEDWECDEHAECDISQCYVEGGSCHLDKYHIEICDDDFFKINLENNLDYYFRIINKLDKLWEDKKQKDYEKERDKSRTRNYELDVEEYEARIACGRQPHHFYGYGI